LATILGTAIPSIVHQGIRSLYRRAYWTFFCACSVAGPTLETAPEIAVLSRLLTARIASACSTTARGTKNPGINRNGNVPIIRLGTSAWIRLNGPGAVSTARITTFVSARMPSTFHASASFVAWRPTLPNLARAYASEAGLPGSRVWCRAGYCCCELPRSGAIASAMRNTAASTSRTTRQ